MLYPGGVAIDYSEELEKLRHKLGEIEAVTDLDALRAKIAKLSEEAAAPDLWDDQEKAQAVTSKLSHAQSELERVQKMEHRLEDTQAMFELAEESEGEERQLLHEEAQADLAALDKDLSELEIRTLMSGEYDER